MTEHDEVILAQGKALRVVAIMSAEDTCPALDFLDSLARRPCAQFRALLERMADEGRILGEERFRKLTVPSATALGVRPSEITQRLSGARNLTLRTLAEMLDALDCDIHLSVVDRTSKGAYEPA